MPSFISGANITDLCSKLADNSAIDPKLYENSFAVARSGFSTKRSTA